MNLETKKPIDDLDEVDRKWAADGAAVLARVAQGDCHLDEDGWWVETSTGKLIGIDPTTDRPILSDAELRHAIQRDKQLGRPKSDNPKQIVTIRLDADLVARLKADGAGWQTRVNDMLRKAIGLL